MALSLLRKPKSGALEPTVAIGQPMPPVQQIPEPVDMVGRFTGIRHAALGDGPTPETVHVVPSSPSRAIIDNDTGEVSYAQGGIFQVGPNLGNPWGGIDWGSDNGGGTSSGNGGLFDLWGGRNQPSGGGSTYQPYYNSDYANTYGGWGQSSYYDPTYANTYGSQSQQPSFWDTARGNPGSSPAYAPSSSYPGDPTQALWQARNAGLASRYNVYGARGLQLGAQQNALNAGLGVLNAEGATFPYQTAQRQAQSRVIDLSSLRNNAQRGYLQQAGANDQARLGELEGIYAASQNTPDIIRAGEARQAYNAEDRRDQSLGVSAPVNLTLPPGASVSQPGVRGAIQTQEQALTRQANYQDPIRQAQLSIAQNAVQLQDTDVEAARLEAQRAGLSLDEANQLVAKARLNQGYAENEASAAGLGVSQAQQGVDRASIDEAMAQQPPAPGLVAYTNPETGESQWVTPDERNRLQAQYQYGPYGEFVRQQSRQLYGDTTGANLSLAQVTTALRRGAMTEDEARAYIQRLRPNLSAEDIDRIIQSVGGRRAGGQDVVIG